MQSEVLELLLTARYVGSPAFRQMGSDIDSLVSRTSALERFGAGLSLVGTAVTAASVGLGMFAVDAMKHAAAYQDAVQRMIAVGSIASNQYGQLQDAIFKTSDRFGQSSTDIANGLYIVTSTMNGLGANLSSNRSTFDWFTNQFVPAMGAYVAASGHGLPNSISWATAGKDVTRLGAGLNIPISQWPTMLGQLTAVENLSGADPSSLMQALLRAAPSARQLGVSPADLFASMAATATAGNAGARAGTQMGSAWRSIITNSTSLKALASLGIKPEEFFGADKKILDTSAILGLIDAKLAGVTDPAKRFKLQSQIFGAVGNRTMGLLADPAVLAMQQRLMAAESSNPLQRMLGVGDKQLADFTGSVNKLKEAFNNFLITVGGPLMAGLKPIIDGLTQSIINLTNALRSPSGQNILAHLPQLVFGGIAAGGIGGPAMMAGGQWLQHFAHTNDTRHAQTSARLASYNESAALRRKQLEDQLAQQRLAYENQIATVRARGIDEAGQREMGWRQNKAKFGSAFEQWVENGKPGATLSAEQRAAADARLLKPGSGYLNTLADQRIAYIMEQSLPATGNWSTGKVADKTLAKYLTAYRNNPSGPTAGMASHRLRNYVNANWERIAEQQGFGAGGPDAVALMEFYRQQETEATTKKRFFNRLGPIRPGGAPRAEAELARLESRRASFETSAARKLAAFDETVAGNAPGVAPSGMGVIGEMFRGAGRNIWGFGQRLSPLNLLHRGAGRAGGAGQGFFGRFASGWGEFMHEGLPEGATNKIGAFGDWAAPGGMRNIMGGLHRGMARATGLEGIGGKIEGGAGKAGAATLEFFKNIPAGLKALPQTLLGIAKGGAGAAMSILSFGSALLPIIAVVLLVVGAITLGVLIFTRFRKEATEVGKAFLSGMMPIFKMVMGVIMQTLAQVQQAWKAHSKEINAAVKGFLDAVKSAIPFFQVLGAIIGVVIMIIVKVIGYLVTAFIAALPYIIGVFTSIFRILGDFGRLIQDVIHGKWGKVWQDAKAIIQDGWNGIKNIFMMLWTFISTVFTNLWNDIKGPIQGFWNSLTGWFSNLGKAIGDALKNAFKNSTSSLGGVIHAALSSIPGFALVAKSLHIAGFASGGEVRHNQVAWVGEHGKELVMLPAGSRVFNHNESMEMASRGSSRPITLSHHGDGGHDGSRELAAHITQGVATALKEREKPKRNPAEEYFFTRHVQESRERVWDRYPNTSRDFDNTYRQAYQYYG